MKDGDIDITQLAFRLQHSPGVGRVGLGTILRKLQREAVAAEEFLQLGDKTLVGRFDLRIEAVRALRNPSDHVWETWEQLRDKGVVILLMGTNRYPSQLSAKLGQSAPPILYALGNEHVLRLKSVGFCGSRKASDRGLAVADACARLLASEEINVVSGYAHGVDLAAHRGALEAGGSTTIVLAEGILRYRVKEQIRSIEVPVTADQVLVVSEFPPLLPWKAHNAMTRNRTICGLSDALVVIESGVDGGTFEAGKTALELGEPLFCVEYSEPAASAAGNAYFLEHGATRLRKSKSGQPNLTRLLAAVRTESSTPREAALSLD